MDCPCRWTIVAIIINLSFQDTTVSCQNVVLGEAPGSIVVRDNRDCSRPCGNPTSTELYNSILTTAATNGVLPDLIPLLQGQPIVDNFHKFPQELLAKPLSVVPMPTCGNGQEPIIISSQPIRPCAPNPNVIVATPFPCGSSCPLNLMPAVPQTILPPGLPPCNCIPQFAQAAPIENYPICAQNAGVVLPMPIVLQPQCQFNEFNPYNVYNPIVESITLPEVNKQPLNLPIMPPPKILPIINTCSECLEITPSLGSPCLPQPWIGLTSDSQQQPLNLQINVPTPSVPAPRITVVSATPANAPVSPPAPCYPDFPANIPPCPPQPPIVLGGCSGSKLRNLLPIILMVLFSDRGCNNGGGNCCCCCCGNSGNSGNVIPIPYPIPIPVNNPIINTSSYPCSSRNRESRDDGDDDEEKKRK